MEKELVFLAILIGMSGFFSGAEIALFSLSEAKVRLLLEQDKKNSHIIKKLKDKPQRLLIAILIGNNLINIGASSLATVVAINKLGSAGAGVATGVMTFLILFFGEIIPKSIAQRNPAKIALIIAPMVRFITIALSPFVLIMHYMTKLFQKLVGANKLPSIVSEEDVKAMVDISHEAGGVEHEEKEMIKKVFLLNDIRAKDVMTPKEYIVGFDTDTTLEEAVAIIEESGYSRFPVSNNGGEIVGIVYIKEVFAHIADQAVKICSSDNAKRNDIFADKVSTLLKPAIFVPDTMQVGDLMKDMQSKRIHIAIVVNEHGATQGLVTLEDILEEVVGEIIDETDVDDNLIKRVDENSIIIDSRVSINKVNWFFNSKLQGPEHKNIGWLVLREFGRIPEKGDSITIQNYIFRVEEAEDRRIKRLMMIKTAQAKIAEKK